MRAAMTSINFFEAETAGLSMKEVAAEKLHHLTDAKNYLELFLRQSLKSDQKLGGNSEQLVKRVKDIQRLVHLKFLKRSIIYLFAHFSNRQLTFTLIVDAAFQCCSHLSTVCLQIDVCRYLARKEEAQNGELVVLASPQTSTKKPPAGKRSSMTLSTKPALKPKPTLFATDPDVKHDLAAMVNLLKYEYLITILIISHEG